MDSPERTSDADSLCASSASVDLDRVWNRIASEAWASQPGRVERLARLVLRSPPLARALVVTPSLLVSWILASVSVLVIGVILSHSTGTPWVSLLAPALAGAGIAYAYGPGIDPAFEIVESMPVSHRMILLTRGLAVFGVNATLGFVASLVSSSAFELTLGWLLPMTTVSAIGLAGATLARSANIGLGAALTSWAMIIAISATSRQGVYDLSVAVSDQRLVPLYLFVTIAMILLTLYASSSRRGRERSTTWQLP